MDEVSDEESFSVNGEFFRAVGLNCGFEQIFRDSY